MTIIEESIPVGKGTGLGFSISYQIIEKHEGRIEVNSKIGQEAEFAIYLPVKHPSNKDLVAAVVERN
ncbi:ATP-binding protein [Microcoleus sp. A2-C5]|nr:ATP-binding protein [Lyngbya sp. CCAP 1446/10]